MCEKRRAALGKSAAVLGKISPGTGGKEERVNEGGIRGGRKGVSRTTECTLGKEV